MRIDMSDPVFFPLFEEFIRMVEAGEGCVDEYDNNDFSVRITTGDLYFGYDDGVLVVSDAKINGDCVGNLMFELDFSHIEQIADAICRYTAAEEDRLKIEHEKIEAALNKAKNERDQQLLAKVNSLFRPEAYKQ